MGTQKKKITYAEMKHHDIAADIFKKAAEKKNGKLNSGHVNNLFLDNSDLENSGVSLQDFVNRCGGLKAFIKGCKGLTFDSGTVLISNDMTEQDVVDLLLAELENFREECYGNRIKPDMGKWYERYPHSKKMLTKYGGVKAFSARHSEKFMFDGKDSMPLKVKNYIRQPAPESSSPPNLDRMTSGFSTASESPHAKSQMREVFAVIADRIKNEYHGQVIIADPGKLPRDPELRKKNDPPRDAIIEDAVRKAGDVKKFMRLFLRPPTRF